MHGEICDDAKFDEDRLMWPAIDRGGAGRDLSSETEVHEISGVSEPADANTSWNEVRSDTLYCLEAGD